MDAFDIAVVEAVVAVAVAAKAFTFAEETPAAATADVAADASEVDTVLLLRFWLLLSIAPLRRAVEACQYFWC